MKNVGFKKKGYIDKKYLKMENIMMTSQWDC